MRRLLIVLMLSLLPALSLAAATREPSVENKWRLQFSGGARADGVLRLALTPKGGERREIGITIAKGTGENAVARRVRDVLKAEIGADYHVETDDGEDVLVKRRRGRPVFNVTVVQLDVQGVRVNLDQE